MYAASLMMDSNAVYQPKTPMKTKWEYIYEILSLHRGYSYPWDDPNYVDPYQNASYEMGAYIDYGETTTFLVNHEDDHDVRFIGKC